jgi:hypothetical protein
MRCDDRDVLSRRNDIVQAQFRLRDKRFLASRAGVRA